MNYYETLYIVHPTLESGRLKDIILSLEESLKNVGGKTLFIDLWGKKRLAYFIDKQKYGTYVQLQFMGEGNCTRGFGMELEHNPNILSYLTTLIKETDVEEQKNDLDTQIAGQSRETQRIVVRAENANEINKPKDSKLSEDSEIPLVADSAENTDAAEQDKVVEDPALVDDGSVSDANDKPESDNKDKIEESQKKSDDTTTSSEEE